MKTVWIWGVAGAAAVGAGVYAFQSGSAKGETTFRTAAVERGTIVEQVNSSGTLQPVSLVQVGSQVSGTIDKLFVDFNSRVKAGQPIAQLDPTVLEARVKQDQANLERARADETRVRALLKQAEQDLSRARQLSKADLIPAAELDAAQAKHDSTLAEQEVSRAAIRQAESTLKLSEANRGYATIVSPVDGVVVSRSVDVGQTVAASYQTPELFKIAEDLSRMQVQTSVDEADIGRVREGQPAEFTVAAYPDRRFQAKVSQVRLSPNVIQNVVTYTVILTAENPDRILLPGMTADVSFEVERRENVLRVPNSALRIQPKPEQVVPGAAIESGKGKRRTGVFVPQERKLRPVPVETGITDGVCIEVTGGELKEGDAVVVGVEEAAPESGSFNPFSPPRQGRRPPRGIR